MYENVVHVLLRVSVIAMVEGVIVLKVCFDSIQMTKLNSDRFLPFKGLVFAF